MDSVELKKKEIKLKELINYNDDAKLILSSKESQLRKKEDEINAMQVQINELINVKNNYDASNRTLRKLLDNSKESNLAETNRLIEQNRKLEDYYNKQKSAIDSLNVQLKKPINDSLIFAYVTFEMKIEYTDLIVREFIKSYPHKIIKMTLWKNNSQEPYGRYEFEDRTIIKLAPGIYLGKCSMGRDWDSQIKFVVGNEKSLTVPVIFK